MINERIIFLNTVPLETNLISTIVGGIYKLNDFLVNGKLDFEMKNKTM